MARTPLPHLRVVIRPELQLGPGLRDIIQRDGALVAPVDVAGTGGALQTWPLEAAA